MSEQNFEEVGDFLSAVQNREAEEASRIELERRQNLANLEARREKISETLTLVREDAIETTIYLLENGIKCRRTTPEEQAKEKTQQPRGFLRALGLRPEVPEVQRTTPFTPLRYWYVKRDDKKITEHYYEQVRGVYQNVQDSIPRTRINTRINGIILTDEGKLYKFADFRKGLSSPYPENIPHKIVSRLLSDHDMIEAVSGESLEPEQLRESWRRLLANTVILDANK